MMTVEQIQQAMKTNKMMVAEATERLLDLGLTKPQAVKAMMDAVCDLLQRPRIANDL